MYAREAFSGFPFFSLRTHIHSDLPRRKPTQPPTFYMLRILRFRALRTPVADLRRAADPSPYKKWFELSTIEKDVFVSTFRDIYRNRYPASGTNSKLHMLLPRTHDPYDTPSLFGIFYDDIWKVVNRTNRDNHRFSDQSFKSLLVRRRA